MLKYTNTEIVFQEFPDETTLVFNISGCPVHCKGCHSKWLWEDTGTALTIPNINKEIKYEVKARRPGDPAILIANSNKAFRKLNWTPIHSSLEEILTDALRWRQNRKY